MVQARFENSVGGGKKVVPVIRTAAIKDAVANGTKQVTEEAQEEEREGEVVEVARRRSILKSAVSDATLEAPDMQRSRSSLLSRPLFSPCRSILP